MQDVDLLIIGTGLNAIGIAADAANRGLSVRVVDNQAHLNSAQRQTLPLLTSGINHLEGMNLSLLWRHLKEQKTHYQRAPQLCQWQWAYIPSHAHYKSLRQLNIGKNIFQQFQQWVYHDAMPNIHQQHKPENHKGIFYLDCLLNSQQLLKANRQLAIAQGAQFFQQHSISQVARQQSSWVITLKSQHQPSISQTLHCKAIVNAAGIDNLTVCEQLFNYQSRCKIDIQQRYFFRLLRHHYPLELTDMIHLLPAEDKNGLYCIPVNSDEYLIGGLCPKKHTKNTQTDALIQINQLLNSYQYATIKEEAIKEVMPISCANIYAADLHGNMDYALDLVCPDGNHPLLNVFGGENSCYRLMAEQALDSLSDYLPAMKKCQTHKLTLT